MKLFFNLICELKMLTSMLKSSAKVKMLRKIYIFIENKTLRLIGILHLFALKSYAENIVKSAVFIAFFE